FKSSFAAGRHLAHLRDSFTHWASFTGSLGHGASNSETHVDQSFFSRAVSELVSTPAKVTSVSAVPGVWPAPAELRQVLWYVARATRNRGTIRRGAIDVGSLDQVARRCERRHPTGCTPPGRSARRA